jgi:hypothetical protein
VGSFGGALIITADTSIFTYNSAGVLQKTFTGLAGFVLQASTVDYSSPTCEYFLLRP